MTRDPASQGDSPVSGDVLRFLLSRTFHWLFARRLSTYGIMLEQRCKSLVDALIESSLVRAVETDFFPFGCGGAPPASAGVSFASQSRTAS
jgi:hypothetical protein